MNNEINQIQEFENLIWKISQKINLHTRQFLAREGLTMSRFITLSNLAGDKPLTMGELQRRLSLAPATLTGLIDGLVEAGLVKRWREDYDRRAVFLNLTADGAQLLRTVFNYRVSILEKCLADHDDIDWSFLNNLLNRTLIHINSYNE